MQDFNYWCRDLYLHIRTLDFLIRGTTFPLSMILMAFLQGWWNNHMGAIYPPFPKFLSNNPEIPWYPMVTGMVDGMRSRMQTTWVWQSFSEMKDWVLTSFIVVMRSQNFACLVLAISITEHMGCNCLLHVSRFAWLGMLELTNVQLGWHCTRGWDWLIR